MKAYKGKYKLVEERTSKNTGKPYWLIQLGDDAKNNFCVTDAGMMDNLVDGCEIRLETGDIGNAVTKLEILSGGAIPVEEVKDEPKQAFTGVKIEEKAEKLGETASGVPTGASHVPPKAVVVKEGENYFSKLQTVKCETEKKGNLTYISWANAWAELKKVYSNATFEVYENENGMPYFADDTGGFVKVGVKVNEVEHISHLPIMDFKNKAIKKAEMDAFAINKAIMRAFTKAIALHGLGLYVYKGEDLPEE